MDTMETQSVSVGMARRVATKTLAQTGTNVQKVNVCSVAILVQLVQQIPIVLARVVAPVFCVLQARVLMQPLLPASLAHKNLFFLSTLVYKLLWNT